VGHTIDFSPEPDIESYQRFSIDFEQSQLSSAWWMAFDPPVLDSLMYRSLSNNYDIAQSIAVLNQSRALSAQTASNALPQIDLSGNSTKSW